jgi:hypothetical protein
MIRADMQALNPSRPNHPPQPPTSTNDLAVPHLVRHSADPTMPQIRPTWSPTPPATPWRRRWRRPSIYLALARHRRLALAIRAGRHTLPELGVLDVILATRDCIQSGRDAGSQTVKMASADEQMKQQRVVCLPQTLHFGWAQPFHPLMSLVRQILCRFAAESGEPKEGLAACRIWDCGIRGGSTGRVCVASRVFVSPS